MGLPAGTVTFCMTDIEGSTRLLAELGPSYAELLGAHHAIVRAELARHRGLEVETEGDSFFAVFVSAVDAVRAAAAVQRCLAAHRWPGGQQVRVRIGLHTGQGTLLGTGYVGIDVHRVARVCAAGHGGQVLLTAPTHALVEGAWPDGMGAVPLGAHRLKDLPVPEVLHQLTAPDLGTRFPPLRSLERPRYELPPAPAPIFGRERDAERVAELLRQHRLVTLTGPGGVGKTRLALHVAGRPGAEFPDGVVFVPLAEVDDADLVPDEIARALALPAAYYGGPAGSARLAGHLHGRRMLVVLDNVEQLAEGAEVIARLLQAAPGPRVLATSRGALHLREEQQYLVPPLDREAAVEQFAERALAVRPELSFGADELAAVERIVDGVGGLPLAVELAAARVRMLGPAEIADRLGSQLRLLSGGPRDLPRRQQALRSTLQWSTDLLDDTARRVFALLAVFPGGATFEALEQVLPAVLPDVDAIEPLEALVDQGLVRRGGGGAERFTMLPVVREYAAELLAGDPAAPEVWRRAAERVATLAAETGPRLVTAERAECLDRVQAEHDNLRAALGWATEHAPGTAASIAAPLWRYWQMRGYLREGRAALSEILRRLPEDDAGARSRVLTALGGVAYWQRDLPASEEAYAGAARLAEEIGDRALIAEALYNLSFAVWQRGRLPDAADLAQRSRAVFEDLGDHDGMARVLWLNGIIALLAGRLDDAEDLLSESVRRHTGSADSFTLGWSLRMLGRTRLLQGRPVEARPPLERALRLFAASGDVSGYVLHLADFATLAALEGDVERELRLVGAMRRLRDVTGIDLVDHPVNAVPGVEETVARLGADASRMLAEGAAMSDEDVVRYALREVPEQPGGGGDRPSAATGGPPAGSPRPHEGSSLSPGRPARR